MATQKEKTGEQRAASYEAALEKYATAVDALRRGERRDRSSREDADKHRALPAASDPATRVIVVGELRAPSGVGDGQHRPADIENHHPHHEIGDRHVDGGLEQPHHADAGENRPRQDRPRQDRFPGQRPCLLGLFPLAAFVGCSTR